MTRSAAPTEHETANDRFKRGFASWFWAGLFLATLLHTLLFVTAPTFATEEIGIATGQLSVLEIPDEIRIPPPPEAVPRPRAPVIVDEALLEDTDVTIAPTTLDANPVESLPPPPSMRKEEAKDLADAPTFTPMTVRPTLTNAAQITRVLMEQYPPLLRDAGIGGTVQVWFFIDETGRVAKTQIHQPSGFDAFDQAALRVADRMRFTPAYNRDQRVQVWVSIPITFEVLR